MIYKRAILSILVIPILCFFSAFSYADNVNSNKYNHNKSYFDYYEEKPAKRHEKSRKHRNTGYERKHITTNNHSHRHNQYCKRRQSRKGHRHFIHERPRHHRSHSHHRFNTGISFLLSFGG